MAVIFLALATIACLIAAIKYREPMMLMLWALSLCAAFLVGLVIDGPVAWVTREKVDITYNLAALNDGTQVQGSFFLGSGTIDTVPSFMYYADDGNGGYTLEDWPASSSRVVETEGEPRAVFSCDDYRTVPPPFRWTTIMISDGQGPDKYVDCNHAFVTFYVPPGSVQREINLDAQ